jgi:transcriptional regulator with XRE-family HTH domain
MKKFGEKLRALRKQRNLTQQELADAIGLATHAHIGNVETGKKNPSLDFVLLVADYFGVSVDSLVRDELELD